LPTAVEAKAKENVSASDLKSLRALAEERALRRYLCVSFDARPRTVGEVSVLPYRHFLAALWNGEYA